MVIIKKSSVRGEREGKGGVHTGESDKEQGMYVHVSESNTSHWVGGRRAPYRWMAGCHFPYSWAPPVGVCARTLEHILSIPIGT